MSRCGWSYAYSLCVGYCAYNLVILPRVTIHTIERVNKRVWGEFHDNVVYRELCCCCKIEIFQRIGDQNIQHDDFAHRAVHRYLYNTTCSVKVKVPVRM